MSLYFFRTFTFLFLSYIYISSGHALTGSTEINSKIETLKPLQPPPKKVPPPTPKEPPPKVAIPQDVEVRSTYLHPGMLVFQNGQWEGGDNLLNLSNNIGVYVEVIKPPQIEVAPDEELIIQQLETLFRRASIQPSTLVSGFNKPPLPAFQMRIFIYSVENVYTVFCQGALFESVTLERFKFAPGMAFQAITWEKEVLFVTTKDKMLTQLDLQVNTIAQDFISTFQIFEGHKRRAIK